MTSNNSEIKKLKLVFNQNINRINSLINIYMSLIKDKKNTKKVNQTDVLRSAVILMHASMEEVIRGLAVIIWPTKDSKFIGDNVPLLSVDGVPKGNSFKFNLSELGPFKNMTIEELYVSSIRQHIYGKFTINDIGQLKKECKNLGIDLEDLQDNLNNLISFFERRHKIVHHADRRYEPGDKQHKTQKINEKDVMSWRDDVVKILTYILDKAEENIS